MEEDGLHVKKVLNSTEHNVLSQLQTLLNNLPGLAKQNSKTICDFSAEYEKYIQFNRSEAYLTSVNLSFKHLQKYFSPAKDINTITPKDIELFLIHLRKTAKEGYRVYFRDLKAAFNRAKDWGYIHENVFTKVKLPSKQRNKPAFVTEEELKKIIVNVKG